MSPLDLHLVIEDLVILLEPVDFPLVPLEELVEFGLPSFSGEPATLDLSYLTLFLLQFFPLGDELPTSGLQLLLLIESLLGGEVFRPIDKSHD